MDRPSADLFKMRLCPVPKEWMEYLPIFVYEEPMDGFEFSDRTVAKQGGANVDRISQVKCFHLIYQAPKNVYAVRTKSHCVSSPFHFGFLRFPSPLYH